jgi:hypothetical protein
VWPAQLAHQNGSRIVRKKVFTARALPSRTRDLSLYRQDCWTERASWSGDSLSRNPGP